MAFDPNILESTPLDLSIDVTDGDLFVGANGPVMIGGLAAVAQLALIAVRLFQEEWFLNLAAGMPWYQEILGEKVPEQLVRRRLETILLAVPCVTSIISLVIEFDAGATRGMNITVNLRTAFGDTGELEV